MNLPANPLLPDPVLTELSTLLPEWAPHLERLRQREFSEEDRPVLCFRPPDRPGASRQEPNLFRVVMVLQFLGVEGGMIRGRVIMGDFNLGHVYLITAVFAREFTPTLYYPGLNRTQPI